MDDFLTIHMDDYLANPQIAEKHNFDKLALIEAIKKSEKYSYDEINDQIKLKYKPKRRIIVFRDIPKENQKKEDMEKLMEFLKEKGLDKTYQKIDFANEIFYVYFEKEEDALEAFKWVEKFKDDNPMFKYSAFVKVENLKKEWLNLQNEEDIKYISNMIMDPNHHKPRKVSLNVNEESTIAVPIKKPFNSKFDKYDPFLAASTNIIKAFNNQTAELKMGNNKFEGHRNKSLSIYEGNYALKNNLKGIPLNKNYDLFNQESKLKFLIKLYKKIVKHKYTLKDITCAYINLNMMKKFSFPEEFSEKNFIKEIMHIEQKSNLDHYKPKERFRDRSHTYNYTYNENFNQNNFYPKNNYINCKYLNYLNFKNISTF